MGIALVSKLRLEKSLQEIREYCDEGARIHTIKVQESRPGISDHPKRARVRVRCEYLRDVNSTEPSHDELQS